MQASNPLNTPTQLEVLRNGGAKVNAELAGFSSATRQRLRSSIQDRRDRLCLTSSFLSGVDTVQFTNETGPSTLFCNPRTIRGYQLKMCTNDVDFVSKSTTSVQANDNDVSLMDDSQVILVF